jgi:hypothetical protein
MGYTFVGGALSNRENVRSARSETAIHRDPSALMAAESRHTGDLVASASARCRHHHARFERRRAVELDPGHVSVARYATDPRSQANLDSGTGEYALELARSFWVELTRKELRGALEDDYATAELLQRARGFDAEQSTSDDRHGNTGPFAGLDRL